jgi:hypothetical protein
MYRDPVVEEIRGNAERIAEECGDDVHRMAERFRREQAAGQQRVISRGVARSAPDERPRDMPGE